MLNRTLDRLDSVAGDIGTRRWIALAGVARRPGRMRPRQDLSFLATSRDFVPVTMMKYGLPTG
jgi:hypothetical protein